ncbi:MAG: carbohydrate ABC transporter permease [Anaerolineae bacterium]
MRRRRNVLEKSLVYTLLTFGGAVMVFPFLWMVSTSLKEHIYVIENPPSLLPRHPTFANFIEAWNSFNFKLYFVNSLGVAISTTLFAVLFSAMLAYAFARFVFPGKEILFYAFLFTMMVPGLVLIFPQFFLAKSLHLRNSLWGLILVYVATNIPLNSFLLRGFFEQLPRELEGAVLIDGGGYFTIFFRIVLPLSTPALATVAIFTFLFSWSEYVWALTAIDEMSKRTLPIAIALFQSAHGTEWGLVFAASLISAMPVIAIFVSLQRYFMGGLTSGAFK